MKSLFGLITLSMSLSINLAQANSAPKVTVYQGLDANGAVSCEIKVYRQGSKITGFAAEGWGIIKTKELGDETFKTERLLVQLDEPDLKSKLSNPGLGIYPTFTLDQVPNSSNVEFKAKVESSLVQAEYSLLFIGGLKHPSAIINKDSGDVLFASAGGRQKLYCKISRIK